MAGVVTLNLRESAAQLYSGPLRSFFGRFFHGGLLFLRLLFHHFPVLFGIQLPSPFNISHD
jgi:hypothetical protein